jgi:hypothetical protein
MYFEVKAFNNGTRRFENLDNFQELQEFCGKYSALGFTKLIVKAFNSEGFKTRNFYTFLDGQFIKIHKDKKQF